MREGGGREEGGRSEREAAQTRIDVLIRELGLRGGLLGSPKLLLSPASEEGSYRRLRHQHTTRCKHVTTYGHLCNWLLCTLLSSQLLQVGQLGGFFPPVSRLNHVTK